MRKVRFIYNPVSGETMVGAFLDNIIELYQQNGFMIEPYRLDFKDDPVQAMADLDGSYHHLLVAGGDGTVNLVVNMMKSLGLDIPLAVLPAGTANDFASLLGMPADLMKACREIVNGRIRTIDLGWANDKWFVNVFSCGLFTDVSQKTPTILKNNFGKLAYYVNGIGELPNFRKMNLSIHSDGGDFEGAALIFFVFNGKTAGKFPVAYLSEVDDGLLDVLIVRGDNPFRAAQTIIRFFSATLRGRMKYPAEIVHLQCSRLTADSLLDETTDVDGQAGPGFPLDIRCVAGALRVITADRERL